MTRIQLSCAVALIALLLEISSIGVLDWGGRTSFLLVALLLSSLLLEPKEAVLLGGVSGLLLDLSVGHLVGMHALIYALVCFAVNRMQLHFFRESMILAIVVGLVGTVLYYASSALLLLVIAPRFLPGAWFLTWVVASAVLNAFWIVLLYPVAFGLFSDDQTGSWGRGKSVD